MKQLINIIQEDYKKEGFTRRDYIIYGIVAPALLVILCAIG